MKPLVGRERQDLPMAAERLDPSRLPSYPYDSYREIGLNDLLARVVDFLEENKRAATFENITVAAHHMFPAKFSLVGYAQFPDATRVQLVILHLGPKYVGWLEGKKKIGYYLNARGRDAAKATAARLGTPPSTWALASNFAQDNLANRTAVETRIARLRDSASFKQYTAGDGEKVDDVALSWDAFGLFITADSPTKAETYRQLLEAARRHEDRDVEHFLTWVSKERPHLTGRSAALGQTPTKPHDSKRRRRR